MANLFRFPGNKLTKHIPQPAVFGGKTITQWLQFYGLIATMVFLLVFVYTKHLELFDDIENKAAEYQTFVMWFSGLGIAIVIPAIVMLFWWLSRKLVEYSTWQQPDMRIWRWFWFVLLCFYFYVLVDPLDNIHTRLSFKGLGPAPDLIAMFEPGYSFADGIPLMQFQYGYFLLWLLFWFLVAVLHLRYLYQALSIIWFYTRRVHRYGASVLTGFRETAATAGRPPVTSNYPDEPAQLPPAFRGAPVLNVENLTTEQAAAIIAADTSGAISAAPGQPTVLFVDLGRYHYSPALAALAADDGTPLLAFSRELPPPTASREELVVPLRQRREGGGD
jgi:hypothetical protein